MTRVISYLFAIALLFLLASGPGARGAASNELPDFSEVYQLVRAHLAGASEVELNRAAVEGLLTSLSGKVTLVGHEVTAATKGGALVCKSEVLGDDVAYVRVGRVKDGLAEAVSGAYQPLRSTNQLKGLVLDLRFADGEDYAAAAAAGDWFVTQERPLLDWGKA